MNWICCASFRWRSSRGKGRWYLWRASEEIWCRKVCSSWFSSLSSLHTLYSLSLASPFLPFSPDVSNNNVAKNATKLTSTWRWKSTKKMTSSHTREQISLTSTTSREGMYDVVTRECYWLHWLQTWRHATVGNCRHFRGWYVLRTCHATIENSWPLGQWMVYIHVD